MENPTIPEVQSLSTEEYRLIRWMLENAGVETQAFIEQLDRATVVSRCGCGCASIDLAIDGEVAPGSGLSPIGEEFHYGENGDSWAAFVYERGGQLLGLELYQLASEKPAPLPTPEELRVPSI